MKEDSKMYDLEKRITELKERQTVYNIMFRNAGVGILFYIGSGQPESYQKGWELRDLIVHQYYPSLKEAVEAEHARLDQSSIPA